MRAYFFTNTWLSGLQKGLQAKHCGDEIALKVLSGMLPGSTDAEMFRMWHEWAKNHKTVIVLDGGSHADLIEITELFNTEHNFYPWASFSEDEESLNGAMTAVGIVLPEFIYEWAKNLREGEYSWDAAERKFNTFELKLLELLNSCSLAR